MAAKMADASVTEIERLPPWFRQGLPDMETIREMKTKFRLSGLHTVCESALCPNMGKCWKEGVATFLILGDVCTRACRFCAVKSGRPRDVDANEPDEIAAAVKDLGLKYVVITSVTRDDLPDEGVQQFVATVLAVRRINPSIKAEVLIPDFSNRMECLSKLAAVQPEVVSHNIETVRRLSASIRPQADYERSLNVLKNIKSLNPSIFTKSGFMVGLGETAQEVFEAMRDLRAAGCDILTIGQYLAPTQLKRHVRVQRFATPEEFDHYREKGLEFGFAHVMSAPLARSSFIAESGYQKCLQEIYARTG
ncbi:MAG TPA: lipoyl synthase [Candidatus Omnitrophota bacterium]|nr:lipoyl synthase [Candidatus Omnitrophota bacterium]